MESLEQKDIEMESLEQKDIEISEKNATTENYLDKIADLRRLERECAAAQKETMDLQKQKILDLDKAKEEIERLREEAQVNKDHMLQLTKLVELYKQSSEEWSKKAGDFEGVIKAMEENYEKEIQKYQGGQHHQIEIEAAEQAGHEGSRAERQNEEIGRVMPGIMAGLSLVLAVGSILQALSTIVMQLITARSFQFLWISIVSGVSSSCVSIMSLFGKRFYLGRVWSEREASSFFMHCVVLIIKIVAAILMVLYYNKKERVINLDASSVVTLFEAYWNWKEWGRH